MTLLHFAAACLDGDQSHSRLLRVRPTQLVIAGWTGRNSAAPGDAPNAPLMPQQTSQLVWLGLSPETLAVLTPYITLLPMPTPVNLNTASAPVLEAMVPGLDMASARQWVRLRERGHWATLDAARLAWGPAGQGIDAKLHSVSSQFFEVRGRMRIDQVVQEELALVQRDSGQVRMLWRVRSTAREPALATVSPALQ